MKKQKQSQLDYNKFIQELELIDIAMESGRFMQKRTLEPKKKCKIDARGSLIDWKKFDKDKAIFRHKTIIKIKQGQRIVFETDCIYVLIFQAPSKFSKKFYDQFVERSNHFQAFLWPYIRQWFAEITDRAMLPRFTAPLVKSLIKSPIPKIIRRKPK